jgi:hypothetical protein
MAIRIALTVVVLAIVGLFGWMFVLNPEALSALRQWAGDTAVVKGPAADGLFAEEEDTYSIRVQYPPRTPLASAQADARARATMEQGIGEAINEFKQLADPTLMSAEELSWATERPYALDITHREYAASGTVSYVYQIYSDTGGAHPNAFFRTFTFDESGAELMLEDLFVENAPYLPRISEKVYAGVMAQLEEKSGAPVEGEAQETVRLGTAPTPEALQFFYLTGTALHIIIPPYQAAAWAAGSFDVAIPLTELTDILN